MAWRGRALQQVHPSADSGVRILHPSLGPDCDDPDIRAELAEEAHRAQDKADAERARRLCATHERRWQEGISKRPRRVILPGGDTRIEPADLRERSEYYGRE